MSLNLIPGYDFGLNEVVDRTKLMAWIAGTDQSGSLTGADLGVSANTIVVAATMSTAITEASLRIDSTHGLLQINTRLGFVPIGLTQGQFFTRRLKDRTTSTATARTWHGAWNASLYTSDGVNVGCPVSSYSAGLHLQNFGVSLSNLNVSVEGAGVRSFCLGNLWPTIEHHNPDGTMTFASSATNVAHLVSFGGWGPWVATCANTSNYTAPSLTVTGALAAHGSASWQTAGGYVLVFDATARMAGAGWVAGESPIQCAWSYPHWGITTRTVSLTRHF